MDLNEPIERARLAERVRDFDHVAKELADLLDETTGTDNPVLDDAVDGAIDATRALRGALADLRRALREASMKEAE